MADPVFGDDSTSINDKLRDIFSKRSCQANAADFALQATLGQGTYGRVRLAESTEVKEKFGPNRVRTEVSTGAKKEDESKEPPQYHTGYFAIKILKKSEIIRLKQTDHVKAERDLLLHKITHPFIVSVHGCYKDERNLYMIMEYVPGGEVLAKCRQEIGKLENDSAKFYAAQLVMALQYLHADNIIYRGMVPDNLLIDKNGYLKLVDFGFAKRVLPEPDGTAGKTYTLCGTAEYLAPEMVNSNGHGKGADWWALGIVIYEMLAGYPPFYAENPFDIYQLILKAQARYPGHFDLYLYEGINPSTGMPQPLGTLQTQGGSASQQAAPATHAPRTGLLARLLQSDQKKRIGCLKNGAEDIKKHKWFRGLNWAALYNKQMAPPMSVPVLAGDDDHAHFPTYPDSVEESGPFLEPAKQQIFEYWIKD